MIKLAAAAAAMIVLFPTWRGASGLKRSVLIRGKPLDVYFYAAPVSSPAGRLLVAPGDGGWRGFALDIAETARSWGYEVFGLDTKQYLESFTGTTTLSEADVMADMRLLAGALSRRPGDQFVFLGWSEGAGLGVLATAAPDNKRTFQGLVAVGLGDTNVLGWRWRDYITYLTRRPSNEPSFSVRKHVANITPLPLFMIQSSHDEYTPVEEARSLFEAARQPKRFSMIEARNHRFDGNRAEFFRVLREAVEWVMKTSG